MERKGNWMQVFSGRQFWPLDPRAEEIDLRDIAHALARQCRYAGHIRDPYDIYSVAEHSVRVGWYMSSLTSSPHIVLAAYLHDAAEAYLVDLPRPIKNASTMGAMYQTIEDRLQEVIAERFGLPEGAFNDPDIHLVDNILCATEKRDIMGPAPAEWAPLPPPMGTVIVPWSVKKAEERFYKEVLDWMARCEAA